MTPFRPRPKVQHPLEREPEPLYLPLDPRRPEAVEEEPDEGALEEQDSTLIVIELA
jgi:hypothetical protein